MGHWVSYETFVFHQHYSEPIRYDHSGVLSPAISLNPKYQLTYSQRRNALAALKPYLKDYVTARKAIFWCALHDNDILIRHQARDILREILHGETAEEIKMVFPELTD